MNDEELITCVEINVNCVTNDPVDVKSGGPYYLGFDFNVKEEELEQMKKFILATLNTLNVPFINLFEGEKIVLKKENVWTKEKIVKEIEKDAEYLQSEATMNYGFSLRKKYSR